MHRFFFVAALVCLPNLAFADGPQDNMVDNVRPVPPPGVKISAADREELTQRVARTRPGDRRVAQNSREKTGVARLVAGRADLLQRRPLCLEVRRILTPSAKSRSLLKLLNQGEIAQEPATRRSPLDHRDRPDRPRLSLEDRRLGAAVRSGRARHRTRRERRIVSARRLVPRPRRKADGAELPRMAGSKNPGQFTPPDAFVLHPYGRYCNANNFAGEIDTFEALEHVRKHYPIDENRIVVRGFSMGGAACWHFAVHYPGLWAAAAPGAGFSETPEFLNVFQKETLKPTRGRRSSALVRLHRLRRQPLQCAQRSPTAARTTARSRPPT